MSPQENGWMVPWLEEAARYFAGRPTHGEDSAHWSNVSNAENCRRIAAHLKGPHHASGTREATKRAAQTRPNKNPSQQDTQ